MKQLKQIAVERDLPITISEGGAHTKVRIGNRFMMVPRHREIKETTANGILKEAQKQ
ncbi:MAG: hypothetical protein PT944_00840 [Actinomycetaceae bacterium]|nr:hypothetical protein [Arcanobacterium sp.]MDD7686454.1 hypothetical protein [Actinomycetaceae bacterium]MDY5272734.1 hypothetical protein [Arcanobacterium sp.]